MLKENVLSLSLIVAATMIGVVAPYLTLLPPVLIATGGAVASIVWIRSSFMQDDAGPFSQWTRPSKFLGMKFSEGELKAIKISLSLVASGFLIIFFLVFLE